MIPVVTMILHLFMFSGGQSHDLDVVNRRTFHSLAVCRAQGIAVVKSYQNALPLEGTLTFSCETDV